jgi:cell fate regulator YaaT (PSP1 superfamily)
MQERQRDSAIHDIEHLERLDMLEEESKDRSPRPRSHSPEDLPETIYRLETMHSHETFYGHYVHAGNDWPHFRSLAQLEAMLEGPVEMAPPELPEDGVELALAKTVLEAEPTDGLTGTAASPEAPSEDLAATVPPETQTETHFIARRALVIAPTKYGKDVVEVQGIIKDKSMVNLDELALIERPAGIDDLRKIKENREKEQYAYEHCREKIWSRNLPMKLVSAHYLLEEPKILFYFTAESRVDFRELVKDLVSLFKTRIELRQIGVRDEARVTGGSGVCGRVLCCNGISDKLNPVSIKMAKDQNLSLNSLKISGPCGRLLCCLSYEYQFYRDARRELPQEGVKFTYDGTLFKVVEVNALNGTVKMAGEDGRILDMKSDRFKYTDGRWKVLEDTAPQA